MTGCSCAQCRVSWREWTELEWAMVLSQVAFFVFVWWQG